MDLRVIGLDRVGNLLDHRRLSCLGRRDDKATLALADWTQQVDDPGREVSVVALSFEDQLLVREQGGQVLEPTTPTSLLGVQTGNRVDPDERRVLLVTAGWPECTLDGIALAK